MVADYNNYEEVDKSDDCFIKIKQDQRWKSSFVDLCSTSTTISGLNRLYKHL